MTLDVKVYKMVLLVTCTEMTLLMMNTLPIKVAVSTSSQDLEESNMEVCVLTVEKVKYGGMCINCGGSQIWRYVY